MIQIILTLLLSAYAFAAEPPVDQPFTVSLECEYHCEGEAKAQTKTFSETFSPIERGLRRGNGNYWGVLGWNLWTWGREWCLEKAVGECSPKQLDENKVVGFALVSMTSKKWEVSEPIDCRERAHNIPSPYGKGLLLNLDETIPPRLASKRRTKLMADPMTTQTDGRKCKNPVKVVLCYGDCLVPTIGKDWTPGDAGLETLASAAPSGTNEVTYCADSFVKEFSGRGLSSAVLKHYCENYVWNRVMDRNQPTAYCAATRMSSECTTLAGKISGAGKAGERDR